MVQIDERIIYIIIKESDFVAPTTYQMGMILVDLWIHLTLVLYLFFESNQERYYWWTVIILYEEDLPTTYVGKSSWNY